VFQKITSAPQLQSMTGSVSHNFNRNVQKLLKKGTNAVSLS